MLRLWVNCSLLFPFCYLIAFNVLNTYINLKVQNKLRGLRRKLYFSEIFPLNSRPPGTHAQLEI